MKRLIIVALMGLMFFGLASRNSFAEQCGCGEMGMHGGPQMMHHGPGFRKGSWAEHVIWKKLLGLNLSDKQREALKSIRFRVEKETIKKKADIELAKVELRELLDKDSVDMSAVEASLKKAESVRTDLRLLHIKAREEIKALLTPEQRKMLKENIMAGFLAHEGKCGGKNGSMPPLRNDGAQRGVEDK